jgi:hypothetical protein
MERRSNEVRRGGSPRLPGEIVVVLRAIAPHPTLWWASLTAVFRLARRGWWRRPPFLPLPGEDYWRFRLVTAYGGGDDRRTRSRVGPTPDDVAAFLRWCQRSRPGRG